ncbi:MAG TPA: hypothetical protein VHB98_00475 [Chloroflexota bacterium]|jgi:hypothetical protein|nr:hypothetical protein [Chloroflexota bacterium]
MRITQVTADGIQASRPLGRNAQVVGPGNPARSADLHIHEQVDQVVEAKQVRDTWQGEYAERVCGCSQCRRAYRGTLIFYARLGTEQPARERISACSLSWYTMRVGGSQLERR